MTDIIIIGGGAAGCFAAVQAARFGKRVALFEKNEKLMNSHIHSFMNMVKVHMASLGCPVIGDKVYGKPALDKKLEPVPVRQMLHAWKLKLWHPVRREQMSFVAPIPADMKLFLI